MRWILLWASCLSFCRPSFSARVYMRACFSSCSPESSMAGIEGWVSSASDGATRRLGKYSPVYWYWRKQPMVSNVSSSKMMRRYGARKRSVSRFLSRACITPPIASSFPKPIAEVGLEGRVAYRAIVSEMWDCVFEKGARRQYGLMCSDGGLLIASANNQFHDRRF